MNSVKHKLFYMNDLHIDSHCSYKKLKSNANQEIQKFVAGTLKNIPTLIGKEKPILILGGDYSNEFELSYNLIQEYAKYAEHIFLVLGNHDYYLDVQEDIDSFHASSYEKIKTFIQQLNQIANVTVLEKYQVHSYKDIKIAGDTSWYSIETFTEQRVFYAMQDSVLIKDFDIQYAHINSNVDYKELNETVDIIVTHVPPIVTNSNHKFGKECFSNLIDELKAKIYCFGHVHENMEYIKAEIPFITNAYLNKNSQFIQLKVE